MTITDERREELARICDAASVRQTNIIDPPFDCVTVNLKPDTWEQMAAAIRREPPADVQGLVEELKSDADYLRSTDVPHTLMAATLSSAATALEALSRTNAALERGLVERTQKVHALNAEITAMRASFTDEAAVEIGRLREVAYNQAREIEDWKKGAANPDKHRSIYLSIFKHHVSVQLDVAGNWVEVIKEYYDGEGHVSHHVSPLGIETAIQAASQSGGG